MIMDLLHAYAGSCLGGGLGWWLGRLVLGLCARREEQKAE